MYVMFRLAHLAAENISTHTRYLSFDFLSATTQVNTLIPKGRNGISQTTREGERLLYSLRRAVFFPSSTQSPLSYSFAKYYHN